MLPENILNLYTEFRELSTVDAQMPSNHLPTIPEDPEKLANFVNELYVDAVEWRSGNFVNRLNYSNPIQFWQALFTLESGAHWEVWGRRNVDPKDAWKSELVDDELSNQVRIKTAYLTANWHRIKITPNVAFIDQIVRQEQQKSDWTSIIRDLSKNAVMFGSSIAKSIMDYDQYPQGLATETVLDNASFLMSPFSFGVKREFGCWYAIHATIQPIWKINDMHSESMKELGVQLKDIQAIDSSKQSEIGSVNPKTANAKADYKHTKGTDHLELWIDDFTLVEATYSDGEVEVEHEATLNGDKVGVHHWQNHKRHVEAHLEYLKSLFERVESEEDVEALAPIAKVIQEHVKHHLQYNLSGMTKKYPFGRKIVRAGGKIVENVPNPHEFDWHRLFHWVDFEKVRGQVWGRGLIEILLQSNKTLDLMISRMADLGLAAVSGPLVNEETLELWKKHGVTNNPLDAKPFTGAPPSYPPQSRTPMEFLQLYKLMKDITSKSQGISSVTYGEAPTPGASGDLAELLLRQNSIIVTGEANINIGARVEDIIETRLLMMKQYYKEPRKYYLAGRYQDVNVSEALSEIPAVDESGQPELDPEGNPIMYELPDLEVTVLPNSNLPNQWETDLGLVVKLISITDPTTGQPVVPYKALYDVLGERYPQFGPAGDYYTVNEATKIGMEVIRQKQEAAAAQQKESQDIRKTIESIAKGVTTKRIRERMAVEGNGSDIPSPDVQPIGEAPNG